MANLSADLRAVSHYPDTRRDLLPEFRGYRSASSAVYLAIKTLHSSIYDDVRAVLTSTDDIVEQLQQLGSRPQNPYLASLIRRLRRHPAPPAIGTTIPLQFEAHVDGLLPRLRRNIDACERVLVDFTELQRRLDRIAAIATRDRARLAADRAPSRASRLHRWLRTSAPRPPPPGPADRLRHFLPILAQGSRSVEHLLARHRAALADLERLARGMRRGGADWARGLAPAPLAHELRRGRKGLAEATGEWVRSLVDDELFLRLNPGARRELNPLARKIEAEAPRRGGKPRVGKE